jgi:DNA-binding TFAR19-related protein (PDSD5 family)
MLHRVALVRTDASDELSASFIRVTRIGELGTTLVTANVVPVKIVSSGILRRVALVRADVSEELRASIIRVTRFGGSGTGSTQPREDK